MPLSLSLHCSGIHQLPCTTVLPHCSCGATDGVLPNRTSLDHFSQVNSDVVSSGPNHIWRAAGGSRPGPPSSSASRLFSNVVRLDDERATSAQEKTSGWIPAESNLTASLSAKQKKTIRTSETSRRRQKDSEQKKKKTKLREPKTLRYRASFSDDPCRLTGSSGRAGPRRVLLKFRARNGDDCWRHTFSPRVPLREHPLHHCS